jgi:hypothetical protein
MAKKTTLTVTTAIGTFTRTTARTYTHIVLVAGYKHEVAEARRQEDLKSQLAQAAKYRRILAGEKNIDIRTDHPVSEAFDRECQAQYLADGSYAKWAEKCEEAAALIIAGGPITQDGGPNSFGIIGWCGRIDLARKLANGDIARTYRTVKIFDVATGQEVR